MTIDVASLPAGEDCAHLIDEPGEYRLSFRLRFVEGKRLLFAFSGKPGKYVLYWPQAGEIYMLVPESKDAYAMTMRGGDGVECTFKGVCDDGLSGTNIIVCEHDGPAAECGLFPSMPEHRKQPAFTMKANYYSHDTGGSYAK